MKVLAIDTSFDDTAAAVVDGRRVLSSITRAQHQDHELFGGVVPEVASRLHVERILPAVDAALEAAGLDLHAIEGIAVTNRPGLLGSLLVGLDAAKALTLVLGTPLVAVHHIEAHVYATFVERPDLEAPLLCLVASGGHTSLVHLVRPGVLRVVGRTLDDAAGEAFDKVARAAGLGLPGGPALSELARRGSAGRVPVPRPAVPGLDFSFSGLKTHAARLLDDGAAPEDVAAAFEAAVVDVLVARLREAAKKTGVTTVALGGGVAANALLRLRAAEMADEERLALVVPRTALCTDNAAMVGCIGHEMLEAGLRAGLEVDARSTAAVGELPFGAGGS